ncbi:MAG TPA: hypothetical protein VNI52_08210 [Sphingobacteriaceae bacterium]|nr:hypothetical protein [Sphingobacteriaceae bacterium]
MKLQIITAIAMVSTMIFSGCTTADQNVSKINTPAIVENKIQPPFRFHKAIEVKPGLTFDVVSWGRGSETSGVYMILRSDSTRLEFKTTNAPLDGVLQDAWNMDMDSDGNPEIFIQAEGEGEGSHLNMYVYEFNNSGNGQKITFPSLSGSMKKGYKGNDSVYVKDGKLMREFPVVEESDAEKNARNKVLEYNLRGNSFSVKEIKEEDSNDKKSK